MCLSIVASSRCNCFAQAVEEHRMISVWFSKVSTSECSATWGPTITGHFAMIDPIFVGVSQWFFFTIDASTEPIGLESLNFRCIAAIPGAFIHFERAQIFARSNARRSPPTSPKALVALFPSIQKESVIF